MSETMQAKPIEKTPKSTVEAPQKGPLIGREGRKTAKNIEVGITKAGTHGGLQELAFGKFSEAAPISTPDSKEAAIDIKEKSNPEPANRGGGTQREMLKPYSRPQTETARKITPDQAPKNTGSEVSDTNKTAARSKKTESTTPVQSDSLNNAATAPIEGLKPTSDIPATTPAETSDKKVLTPEEQRKKDIADITAKLGENKMAPEQVAKISKILEQNPDAIGSVKDYMALTLKKPEEAQTEIDKIKGLIDNLNKQNQGKEPGTDDIKKLKGWELLLLIFELVAAATFDTVKAGVTEMAKQSASQ